MNITWKMFEMKGDAGVLGPFIVILNIILKQGVRKVSGVGAKQIYQ